MPEYLHPGVYIEEQPAPQTIEGVSTSTAGLVGASKKGPSTGLPQLVTSFSDFIRKYGDYLDAKTWGDNRFLAYAVDGFFNNGGQRAYIVRVVGDNATASSITLNDGYVTRLAEDTADDQTARDSVKLVSLLGVSVGTFLTFREDIAGNAETKRRQVTAYASQTKVVTLASTLDLRFTMAGCKVSLSGSPNIALPSAGDASLKIDASSEGVWGDSIEVSVATMHGAVALTQNSGVETTLASTALAFAANGPADTAETIDLTAESWDALVDDDQVTFNDGANDSETVTITKDATPAITWDGGLTNDYSGAGSTIVQITGVIREAANNPTVFVSDTASIRDGDLARLTKDDVAQLVKIDSVDTGAGSVTLDTATFAIEKAYDAGDGLSLATAGSSDSTGLRMQSTSNFYAAAVIEIDDGTTKTYHTVSSIDGTQITLSSNLDRDVPSGTTVRVIEFAIIVSDGVTSESFEGLSLDSDAPRFVEDVVNLRSKLIAVTSQESTETPPFNLPRTEDGAVVTLAGGADGDAPTVDHYLGQDNGPSQRTGIKALADIDGVSILAAPGISDASVHAELVGQCALLKDRFAVLDSARGSVMGSGQSNDIEVQRSNIDSLYGAIYYPWMRIRDPLAPLEPEGRLVPPSGHMIGIYARTDRDRGVHKAPANVPIRGITGLEFKLSDREQDILNPKNINVLRDFRDSNRGIRVWGARCTTSDSAWRYIPVRRLFIYVEESLEEGLQWVVFEPNGQMLWARVRRTINGFLKNLWLNGALAGVTEDEAFFVRCGFPTTMSEDDLDNGRLIVLVGIATLKPAEFVIIRISQKTLDSSS
ncbi:MAG: phage tail sheath subtilisin-like domain-containing protein [Chloroflexi bacterium]|nr:phage tail sheath subtilisin-like domain-containing protein [Chloroflexota bacterium]